MTDEDAHPDSAYGVEFGPLKQALREHAYPVTRSELIEQYGGFEIEHGNGSDLLESVLRDADAPTFRGPVDVRDAILAELEPEAMEAEAGSESPDGPDDWSPTSV